MTSCADSTIECFSQLLPQLDRVAELRRCGKIKLSKQLRILFGEFDNQFYEPFHSFFSQMPLDPVERRRAFRFRLGRCRIGGERRCNEVFAKPETFEGRA